MAITFTERRKKFGYLVPVLIIIILLTVLVFLRGFFAKEKLPILPAIEVKEPIKKIEINYTLLENPFLEELQLLEPIPFFDGEIGRENPFVPYQELPKKVEEVSQIPPKTRYPSRPLK